MRYPFVFVILSQLALGQSKPYQLPFASSGNTLELTIANSSSVATGNVSVEAANLPGWLQFSQTQQRFDHLGPGEEAIGVFTFSIEKSAPVNVVQTLRFVITNSNGESWTKEISVSISPPEKFELFQNCPNPFNPSTALSYQLSATVRFHSGSTIFSERKWQHSSTRTNRPGITSRHGTQHLIPAACIFTSSPTPTLKSTANSIEKPCCC